MRYKDPKKRKAIYDAALEIILAEGFSGMKMSAVAKKAEVATGTLYIYFESKQTLINQLYRHLKKKSTEEYIKGYSEDMTFADGFELIWFNYLERSLKRPEEAAFLEQYYRSPYLDEKIMMEVDDLLRPIFSLLEKGKEEGIVRETATELLVAQLSGALNEIVQWHFKGSLELNEENIEAAYDIAWKSVVL